MSKHTHKRVNAHTYIHSGGCGCDGGGGGGAEIITPAAGSLIRMINLLTPHDPDLARRNIRNPRPFVSPLLLSHVTVVASDLGHQVGRQQPKTGF